MNTPETFLETLSAKDLIKIYNNKRVVDDVNITVRRREVTGLLGPNGAGKTTTFYMMVGLIWPDSGKIILDDNDITELPMYLRARKGINYLAQEPSVFRKLTVEDNILAILETLNLSKEERKDRLHSLLNELNISHLAKQRASSLSGGERRRLEITRALVTEPRFILLDEPFAGIDPIAINDIQQIVLQLKGRGIGIIISDHNVRETLKICDNAYLMCEGKILEYGPPETIITSEKAKKVYLGQNFYL